jgi:hypothetical protein
MFNKLSEWLYRSSTTNRAVFFLLIVALFSILILPGQSANAEEFSGEVGTPDLSFFYSTEELYGMAETYGEQGRQAYIQARFTFDLVWPLVYGAFLLTSISRLFLRSIPTYSGMRQLNLLPIFGVIFDYLENISTSWVMWRYPEELPIIATLAPVFTFLKWLLIGMAFLTLIVGIILATKRWLSK